MGLVGSIPGPFVPGGSSGIGFPGSIPVSGLTGEGVDGLLESMAAALPHPPTEARIQALMGR
jgi:hypothetical protein